MLFCPQTCRLVPLHLSGGFSLSHSSYWSPTSPGKVCLDLWPQLPRKSSCFPVPEMFLWWSWWSWERHAAAIERPECRHTCVYTYRHSNDDGLTKKTFWWSTTSLDLYLTLPDPDQSFTQHQFIYHRSHSCTATQHGAVLLPILALRWTGFSDNASFCPTVQSLGPRSASLEISSAHAGNQTAPKYPRQLVSVVPLCLSHMHGLTPDSN